MGCDVMLNGFASAGTIAARVADIEALGVRCAHHNADLRKPAEIADLVNATTTTFGGPDILVNNAVVRYFGATEDFNPEHWDEALAVNLSAPFHTTRLSLPVMKARGWGRIVNMASVYSWMATVNRIDYVTTKTALLGMTRAVALEVARTNITCNAICPGWVLTPLVQKQVDAKAAALGVSNEEAKRLLLAEKEPSLQFTTPEELGALAVFLCSPAADNVRGVAWNMDGGWAAQ
jgi:3-hydroxybutyrate dehydrogenase